MGVSHLHKHSAKAQAMQQNPGSPDSKQVVTPLNSRFMANSGANKVPKIPAVQTESKAALHPKTSAAQPAHGGARAGAKNGKANVGSKDGTAHPMSGGQML